MRNYKITITERFKKDVIVRAETEEEALKKARERYSNNETNYILSCNDYLDADFEVKEK